MTWKEEIKKNIGFRSSAYTKEGKGYRRRRVHKAKKEILEKLMKEIDKISDGALQIIYTLNNRIAKGQMNSRERIEESIEKKVENLLEQQGFGKHPELYKTLMKNELFASVLGDMKYDVEYTRDE